MDQSHCDAIDAVSVGSLRFVSPVMNQVLKLLPEKKTHRRSCAMKTEGLPLHTSVASKAKVGTGRAQHCGCNEIQPM